MFAAKRWLNKFKITKVGADHTCISPTLQTSQKNASSKFVSRFFMPSLKNRFDLTPNDIMGMVLEVYYIEIFYKTAWTAWQSTC